MYALSSWKFGPFEVWDFKYEQRTFFEFSNRLKSNSCKHNFKYLHRFLPWRHPQFAKAAALWPAKQQKSVQCPAPEFVRCRIQFYWEQPRLWLEYQLCSPCERFRKTKNCLKIVLQRTIIAYFPANLTSCLEVLSPTARMHCTVLLCWRKIKKHCLPFEREVWTRPRTQTNDLPMWFFSSGTATNCLSSCFSLDWIISAMP